MIDSCCYFDRFNLAQIACLLINHKAHMTNAQFTFANDIKEQATKGRDMTELRREFIAEATAARKQFIKYREGYQAKDVHKYLRDYIAGKKFDLKLKSW